jgi:cell division protein FtsL
MATALASRPAPVRMRRPAGSVVQPARQPRNKSKSTSQPTERPDLRLVETVHVKRFSLVTSALIIIACVLASIVVFQTVIAEQQLRLDKITTDVRLARVHYDELRQQRAELRAPDYLREKAMMLGMSQGMSAKFEEVPADVVASVIAATGDMDKEILNPPMLEDFVSNNSKSSTP